MMSIRSCKDVCQRIEGTKKRINPHYHNPFEYARCNNCEIYFPKNIVQSMCCPCCSRKLSANPYKKTIGRKRRKYLESIGSIKRY